MEELTIIANCFGILIRKEINVKFLLYCFSKRRGLKYFNNLREENQKLTVDEWELLQEVIKNLKKSY